MHRCFIVVPVMYSPLCEQPPRMCGHVSNNGYLPFKIHCRTPSPAEWSDSHPFHVIFPPKIHSFQLVLSFNQKQVMFMHVLCKQTMKIFVVCFMDDNVENYHLRQTQAQSLNMLLICYPNCDTFWISIRNDLPRE